MASVAVAIAMFHRDLIASSGRSKVAEECEKGGGGGSKVAVEGARGRWRCVVAESKVAEEP